LGTGEGEIFVCSAEERKEERGERREVSRKDTVLEGGTQT
jgi:hypothetical protein